LKVEEVHMTRVALPLLAAVVFSACNEITGPCDATGKAGISLSIVDSASHGPVLVDPIKVIAVDGAYSDSVRFSNLRPDPVTIILLAMERKGVYDVQVSAAGYRIWQKAEIRVTSGRCHVNTVLLTANLQRASS
jgi:hypothetical protein